MISVCVAAYNGGRFIGEKLGSILESPLVDEVLVSDECIGAAGGPGVGVADVEQPAVAPSRHDPMDLDAIAPRRGCLQQDVQEVVIEKRQANFDFVPKQFERRNRGTSLESDSPGRRGGTTLRNRPRPSATDS